MTEPDVGSSYSPVPVGFSHADGQPERWAAPSALPSSQPAPVQAMAPPSPPYPAYPPLPGGYSPQPSAPVRRRRPVLAIVLVCSLVLVLAAVLSVVALSSGTKQLSDLERRITITVPRTWSDDTGPDAGKHVDQGSDDYDIPDLQASSFDGSDLLAVFIEAGSDASALRDAQQASVDEACDYYGCTSHGSLRRVSVNGLPGLQQTLTHPADADSVFSVVLTVESKTLVVSAVAEGVDDDPPHIETLISMLHTLRVLR